MQRVLGAHVLFFAVAVVLGGAWVGLVSALHGARRRPSRTRWAGW